MTEAIQPPDAADKGNVVVLRHAVRFGQETILELELKLDCRAFKEFELPLEIKPDGTTKVLFRPYEFARVGLHMAGKPQAVLDKLHPADMWEVAQLVLGFTGLGPGIGPTDSPS